MPYQADTIARLYASFNQAPGTWRSFSDLRATSMFSMQENYFDPLKDMLFKRLGAYGVEMPPQTWKRIASETGCRQLFEQAGLTNVTVSRKNVGYYLDDANQWWDVVWNAGFRRMVSQLPTKDQERFKCEHLDEVETLRTRDGIWLDVGVMYTVGTKPAGN